MAEAAKGFLILLFLVASALGPAQAQDSRWESLGSAEQQALAPLHSSWSALSAEERRLWRGIAAEYQGMTIAERERMHARMRDWAALDPTQREQARGRYRALQQNLSPIERENLGEQWLNYQRRHNPP